jgi:RimJ/RimL family protein N-acetyltransferase
MTAGEVILTTPRLTLRSWRETDRDAFAALNADPEVMLDLGRPFVRADSNAKFDRYAATFRRHGFSRLAIEERQGTFVGYAGIMPAVPDHPLGPHIEIGWRLTRAVWGEGYATEAAGAILRDAFERLGLAEILAYTAADNVRSQAVMERLGMQRDPLRDFSTQGRSGTWRGRVWVLRRPAPSFMISKGIETDSS